MLATKTVSVLGLEIPYFDVPKVWEREHLEVLAAREANERLGDSRVKYEALRIMAKSRLKKDLPVWLSKEFEEQCEPYFNEGYSDFEAAATELLEPFAREQEVKEARRQAKRLLKLGDVNGLSGIIRAADLTIAPFREALAKLEASGDALS